MKRMNLRDVPDDVYESLVAAAADRRQSLSAYVVERLEELARASRLEEHLASYPAPVGTHVDVEAAVAAVHDGREAS